MCFPVLTHAQDRFGWIEGKIRDASTVSPVENAEILLLDSDGSTLRTQTTAAAGEFLILGLPPGPQFSRRVPLDVQNPRALRLGLRPGF